MTGREFVDLVERNGLQDSDFCIIRTYRLAPPELVMTSINLCKTVEGKTLVLATDEVALTRPLYKLDDLTLLE